MKTLLSIAVLFLLLLSGCYYDSQEYLYPQLNTQCDTTNVTYATSIQPVMQNYCLSCHSNASAGALGGNIKLENYADLKIYADNGILYKVVSHDPSVPAMPLGANKLDDCTLAIIKIWVDAGAPNN
jgi:hypothetical protein